MRTSRIFDPAQEVRILNDFNLQFMRSRRLEEVPFPGSTAENNLNSIVGAILSLERAQVDDLIERSTNWLELAVERGEAMGNSPGDLAFYRSHIRWRLGLANWLFKGENSPAHYLNALEERLAYHASGEKTDIAGVGMEACMPLAYQAGEYDRGVYEYEKLHGANAAPKSLRVIKSARTYGYALNLHHARGLYSPEELHACAERVLTQNLQQNWIGSGFATEGAQWLKIVYWHSGRTKDPRETLLKAYDHMPLVIPPVFVSQRASYATR
jgi:hypothetical protein